MENIQNTLMVLDDLVTAFASASNEVLLFFAIIATGYVIKLCQWPPNRIIPAIGFLEGAFGMVLLGGKLPPGVLHPNARLAMVGIVIWFLAWGTHKIVLSRLEALLPKGWLQEDAPPPPKTVPAPTQTPTKLDTLTLPLILALIIPPVVAGCTTTSNQAAFRATGTVVTTVHGAMLYWNDYVGTGRATIQDELKVKAAYEKYRDSVRVVKSVVVANTNAPTDQTVLDAALASVSAASSELINLINLFFVSTSTPAEIPK